ncbi:MAG: hypothetical protein ACLRP4_05655 [Dialister invisus]|uniref:hypothetical protein n=2 Tax=Dialister invisus TaxID=218538 RepID=UPI0026DC7A85|nr:hypothetical protein [Dialister invisus]
MEILKVRLSTAADRERNLFIESEQDRKSYEEKSKISNMSVSGRPGSAVSVSGGNGHIESAPLRWFNMEGTKEETEDRKVLSENHGR